MKRLHRVVVFLLAVAGSAWVFWNYHNRGHKFYDLRIYMKAMDWWAGGNDLYSWFQPDFLQGKLFFTYPPFSGVFLLPFSYLPLGLVQVLFVLGTIAAVIVTTWWIVRALGLPTWITAPAVPMILAMEPLRETIALGQLNLLLVFLILLDLLVLRPKGSKWAGIGIGLATAIKITPGIFIVYLLITKQWRAAFTAMGTAAGATVLMFAVAPRASWDFWTGALWDTARVGRTDITGNQSLLALLHRLAIPSEPNRLIWLALGLAIVAFGLWRAAQAHRNGNEVVAAALTGLCGGVISPITWAHHLYWIAPALLAVLAAVWGRWSPLWFLLIGGYFVSLFGVVSAIDWDFAIVPKATDTPGSFVGRNLLLLLSLLLIAFTPTRHYPTRTVV